jgi:hypothetical protein
MVRRNLINAIFLGIAAMRANWASWPTSFFKIFAGRFFGIEGRRYLFID